MSDERPTLQTTCNSPRCLVRWWHCGLCSSAHPPVGILHNCRVNIVILHKHQATTRYHRPFHRNIVAVRVMVAPPCEELVVQAANEKELTQFNSSAMRHTHAYVRRSRVTQTASPRNRMGDNAVTVTTNLLARRAKMAAVHIPVVRRTSVVPWKQRANVATHAHTHNNAHTFS